MKILLLIATSLIVYAAGSHAQKNHFETTEQQVGLLELYTSEGCSSCPPADVWLSQLKQNKGVWNRFIPIALHVDYWDYIGWDDRFASSDYSARQRQYAKEQSLKAVYTPGFVYNGMEWRRWYTSRKVDFPAGNRPGVMKLDVDGDVATVNFTPTTAAKGKLQVNIALLGFDLETAVKAGENKGRKLPHDFVVLGMTQTLIRPTGESYTTQLSLPKTTEATKTLGVVAWMSGSRNQKPIQAVGGYLEAAQILASH